LRWHPNFVSGFPVYGELRDGFMLGKQLQLELLERDRVVLCVRAIAGLEPFAEA